MKINKKFIIVAIAVVILFTMVFRREGFTPEQLDSMMSTVPPNQQLTIKDLLKAASEKGELETNRHLQYVFSKNPELKKAVMDAKGP